MNHLGDIEPESPPYPDSMRLELQGVVAMILDDVYPGGEHWLEAGAILDGIDDRSLVLSWR